MLAQSGIIPQTRIAQFLELPDLNAGYSLANNAINAVLTMIDECLEDDVYDIPEYIPIQMLKEEIVNTQLSLRAANREGNKEDIDKLTKLYQKCDELDAEMAQETMDETAEANAANAEEQAKMAEDAGVPVGQNPLEGITDQMATTDLDMSTPDNNNGW